MNDENINDDRIVTDDDLVDMSFDGLVDVFIASMLEEKGIEDEKAKTLAELRGKLIHEINMALVRELPEDKKSGLEQRLNTAESTTDAIAELAEESGVDVKRITKETMDSFYNKYMNGEEV